MRNMLKSDDCCGESAEIMLCVDAGPEEVVACMAVVVPVSDAAMNCSFELREHRSVVNAAFGVLSACIPCWHPWPIDAGAKLMCFKERVGMRLLVFVVLCSR